MEKKQKQTWKENILFLSIAVIMLGAASGIGLLFQEIHFSETNIVIMYLTAVLLTARLTQGYIYGLIASVAATFAFNYFFTDPYYTFNVNDPNYMITFAIMTMVSMVTSAMTSRVKRSAEKSMGREKETQVLYQLTSRLTEARDMKEIPGIAVKSISGLLGCRAACLCFDDSGRPDNVYYQQAEGDRVVQRKLTDGDNLRHRIENLRTSYDEGDEFFDWPIYSGSRIMGIIRIPQEDAYRFHESQKKFLHSLIECTALAMDRVRSASQQMKSQQEMVQERYRGNLLRAISHDLRTPLSGIMGFCFWPRKNLNKSVRSVKSGF